MTQACITRMDAVGSRLMRQRKATARSTAERKQHPNKVRIRGEEKAIIQVLEAFMDSEGTMGTDQIREGRMQATDEDID
eukprot:758027-Hanusia_phi.AAC.1